jgi:hypothetical protein
MSAGQSTHNSYKSSAVRVQPQRHIISLPPSSAHHRIMRRKSSVGLQLNNDYSSELYQAKQHVPLHVPIFKTDNNISLYYKSESSSSPHSTQHGYYFQPNSRHHNSSSPTYYVQQKANLNKVFYIRAASKSDVQNVRRGSLIGSSMNPAQLQAILKLAQQQRKQSLNFSLNHAVNHENESEAESEEDSENENNSSAAVKAAAPSSIACCICSSADLIDPWRSAGCGHICCSECWQTWLNENSSHTCPECSAAVDLEHLQPVSLCLICNNIPAEPYSSPCKHICCLDCWNSYLKENPNCPQCNSSVQKNSITAVS